MQRLTPENLIVIILGTLAIEVLKATVSMTIIPGQKLYRSFMVEETSSTFSNMLPGPSGSVTRYLMYKSYGISVEDFSRFEVINSIANTFLMMIVPGIAVLLLSISYRITSGIWILVGIGIISTLIGIVILYFIARSERFARNFGELCGKIIRWIKNIIGKPTEQDFGTAIVNFRQDILLSFKNAWGLITLNLIGKYIATYILLLYCLRTVGIGSELLPVFLGFTAYAVARLASMIEVTPGGLGVTEVAYIYAFSLATGGQAESQITAAVLIFRAATLFLPIIIGSITFVLWRRSAKRKGIQVSV